jgi:iron(III) transport system substrate-binding protein
LLTKLPSSLISIEPAEEYGARGGKMMKNTVRLAAMLGGVVALWAYGLPAAAETVVVYTNIPETAVNEALSKEFKKQTGIDVQMLVIPSQGAIAARVRSEKDKPRGDVYSESPVDVLEGLAKEGLIEPYHAKAETTDFVKKGYADPNGIWHGWFALTTAIFWNERQFANDPDLAGVKPPQTWDDLLKPEFKGKIILPHPATTSIGYVRVANQIFRLGEEKAWDYEAKLSENVSQYTPSGVLTINLVEQGEGAMGVYWLGDVLTSKMTRKQPVNFVVPQDNVATVWASGIIKNGPNTEAAKKYVDFLQGEAAQQIDAKLGYRTPLNSNVEPPQGATPLAEIKTVKYDGPWVSSNLEQLRKTWSEKTGQ